MENSLPPFMFVTLGHLPEVWPTAPGGGDVLDVLEVTWLWLGGLLVSLAFYKI
jgi:hypothetical protein